MRELAWMIGGKAEFWGTIIGAVSGRGGNEYVMPHDDAARSAIAREFQGKE